MSTTSLSRPAAMSSPASLEFQAARASIGLLVLTSVHHAYGAFVYDAPWRLHVVYLTIPAAAVIGSLFALAWRHRHRLAGRIAGWAAIATGVFSIALIGGFEGAYNHLLKNILYFGGVSATVFRELFPAPTYEIPNDVFFEATGTAQAVVAVIAAAALIRFIRGRLT